MNDDFEKKLQALAGATRRPDPTPAWKQDILARARREAQAIPFTRTAPPRPLLFAWAAAWAAIVLLSVATPHNTVRVPANAVSADRASSANAPTLFALERQYNLTASLQ